MTSNTERLKAGFLKAGDNTGAAMQRLGAHIQRMENLFLTSPEEELLKKPAPGKWSKLEILGHLVDSAINNIRRFTEIQFSAQPYTIVAYQQDALVSANHYQMLPIKHVLGLWKMLNQQIIFLVGKIPTEKLGYLVRTQPGSHELKSLEWLIEDYVAHLEHHLQQIEAK